MEGASAAFFWIIFGVMTCLNLPFIVVDMVYAAAGDACSTMPVPNIAFPLKTWL